MSDIIVLERKPTAEELGALRDSVRWDHRDLSAIQNGLDGTLYGACAFQDGEIIGVLRIVGDGATVFYIQDVIVRPGFQGKGVGRALMERAMAYLAGNASVGATVGLMAALGKEPFYEKFGFRTRPNEREGAGMIQFWKK